MGRAFFSEKYAPVVVHTGPPAVAPYEKWSRWNYFDPDSDEFFDSAQREVFTDTEEYAEEQERIRESVALDAGQESSTSSESSEPSDSGSPMAVGPDDPAVIIQDAYSSADWEHRFLTASAVDPVWRRPSNDRPPNDPVPYPRMIPVRIPPGLRGPAAEGTTEQARHRRTHRPRSATVSSIYLPPSWIPDSAIATQVNNATPIDHPPAHPRPTNVPPIAIPTQPSSPSPISPDVPTTPTDNAYLPQVQTMFTPSPPPSVTPHIYTWNHRVGIPIPLSPLAPQGPIRFLARVNAPMRVQNAAV